MLILWPMRVVSFGRAERVSKAKTAKISWWVIFLVINEHDSRLVLYGAAGFAVFVQPIGAPMLGVGRHKVLFLKWL